MSGLNLKITIAQLNLTVGDVTGNVRRIINVYREANARGADMVVTPELSVSGYPIEDLANSADFHATIEAGLAILRRTTRAGKAALVVGAPVAEGATVHNAAFVFQGGELLTQVRKMALPNYGVFDEVRNFSPGNKPHSPFTLQGRAIGLLICEDLWHSDVPNELRNHGAEMLVAINASPFRPEALRTRVSDVAAKRVAETNLPLLYVNLVGGQDEVVFDGGSFFLDDKGRRTVQLPQWRECVMDLTPTASLPAVDAHFPDSLENLWYAMTLSVRDYVRKNGFTDVVLGLSGGVDSAVVAAIAGDAIGPEHVHCTRMPSRFTTDLSNTAAEEMCRLWGFDLLTLPIEDSVNSIIETVTSCIGGPLKRPVLENMQARVRGNFLMTLSNQYNWLLLSTGNKSEIAVGYCTIYGDMCGGFNPLKDVYKTTVFALARWRNHNRPGDLHGPARNVIPEDIIERTPSAELSPGQKDSDSLPPYELLDAILYEMVEKGTPVSDIPALGFDREMVERVYSLLRVAEYKRRQGAPGPKTSSLALTRDRRMPITNGFTSTMTGKPRLYEKVVRPACNLPAPCRRRSS